MPAILDRLVNQLKEKGYKNPYAVAVSALQKSGNLKKGTAKATAKGARRGQMSPGQRAIDRQSKYSGRPKGDFEYNKETNRATVVEE